jgi:hypothetical protein
MENLTEAENELCRSAAEIMTRAAVAWWKRHRKDPPSGEEKERFLAEIRAEVGASLDEALRDARAATDCGMHAVAQQTFALSMAAGGIRAAKRVAGVA